MDLIVRHSGSIWTVALLFLCTIPPGLGFTLPIGVLLAFIFNAPENARVGANAFRCSLLQLVGIALAVCVALPFVVKALLAL